jgi:hypothetical protein
VGPPQTPSPSHDQFDQICAEVEDFEHLPTVVAGPLEREAEDEEQTSLDGQILVGLVSPL